MKRKLTPAAARALAMALIVSTLLAGCGGRAARPVATATPYDDHLSCDHLRAERRVNAARIADLAKEQGDRQTNNAGFLVAMPLFMDFSGVEGKEVAALEQRNQVLDGLVEKKCPPVPSD